MMKKKQAAKPEVQRCFTIVLNGHELRLDLCLYDPESRSVFFLKYWWLLPIIGALLFAPKTLL